MIGTITKIDSNFIEIETDLEIIQIPKYESFNNLEINERVAFITFIKDEITFLLLFIFTRNITKILTSKDSNYLKYNFDLVDSENLLYTVESYKKALFNEVVDNATPLELAKVLINNFFNYYPTQIEIEENVRYFTTKNLTSKGIISFNYSFNIYNLTESILNILKENKTIYIDNENVFRNKKNQPLFIIGNTFNKLKELEKRQENNMKTESFLIQKKRNKLYLSFLDKPEIKSEIIVMETN